MLLYVPGNSDATNTKKKNYNPCRPNTFLEGSYINFANVAIIAISLEYGVNIIDKGRLQIHKRDKKYL